MLQGTIVSTTDIVIYAATLPLDTSAPTPQNTTTTEQVAEFGVPDYDRNLEPCKLHYMMCCL